MKASLFALCILLVAGEIQARYRALLVGINDYTASRLGAPVPGVPQRGWVTLTGAVNDVEILKQMLVLVYRVDPREIVALTDQAATRDAILQSLKHLADTAARGDVILFYFAGHGSQVRNSLSDERDKLDESIVPADSCLGVPDIRDKELRTHFNRILDGGARLTVILDNCYSGSGARGLATGAQARGVKPDLRDVADGARYGPRPESRGALVLSAAQDTEEARETRDAEGKFHGVFSWAWIRALRDAASGESAVETFYRAQARMRTESPFQSPVIAGTPAAKLAPFLGTRSDRRDDRTVIAVGKVEHDNTVLLQGGWANGLAAGTELRDTKSAARLKITSVHSLGQSKAQVISGTCPQTGALVEVVGWATPPGPPLRVAMPRASRTVASITSFARGLHVEAAQRGIRWVANPIDATPSHVLRWSGSAWEIVDPRGAVEHAGDDDATMAALAKMPPGTSLFVQLPAPAVMADAIDADSVPPGEADYILAGRYANQRLTYSWLRPLVRRRDKRETGLPLQTKWTVAAPDLQKALAQLRKIHAWQTLESPPQARFPYRLQIRRTPDERLVGDGESIVSDVTYKLYLRGVMPLPPAVKKRYVYAFVVDSDGMSTLLFPPRDSGSVENRFPDNGTPMDIPLDGSGFEAAEPFGVDTYFLLSTDEPLPNPNILEWDGVRTPEGSKSALEELLALTAAGTRSQPVITPATWSIERVTFESVRSRATKTNR
jgi:uncharacterized caspase-like protein